MTTNLPPVHVLGTTAAIYARDLAERVVSTFLQAFIGAIVFTSPFDLHMWQAAAVAGVAAAGSLVKGLVARVRGDKNSASFVKAA